MTITAHLEGGPLHGDVHEDIYFAKFLRYPEDHKDGGRYTLGRQISEGHWAYEWTPGSTRKDEQCSTRRSRCPFGTSSAANMNAAPPPLRPEKSQAMCKTPGCPGGFWCSGGFDASWLTQPKPSPKPTTTSREEKS